MWDPLLLIRGKSCVTMSMLDIQVLSIEVRMGWRHGRDVLGMEVRESERNGKAQRLQCSFQTLQRRSVTAHTYKASANRHA